MPDTPDNPETPAVPGEFETDALGLAGDEQSPARAGAREDPPRHPNAPKGITDAEIAAALVAKAGIITHAAAQLGIDRKGLEDRVNRNPILKAVRVESRAELLDRIEGNYLQSLLAKGARPTDLRHYLDTFAQDRGYKPPVHRVGNPDGSPINADTFAQWFAGLTHEQQQRFAASPEELEFARMADWALKHPWRARPMVDRVLKTTERLSEEAERSRERRERSGELGEIRERCATLPGFVREAWPILEPVVPLVWGWAPDAIAEHLQAVSDGEILRLLMNVPPGLMKSLMSCVFWPAFEWGPLGMPGLRILGTAFKVDHAERDTDKMKTLVSSDWYQDLWPEVKLKGKGSSDEFANTMEGWRKGRPIASLTGDRGDRVIVDDPHSVEGGESDATRKKTLRVMRETIPTRLNDPKRSAIVVIMQRIHAADVSGLWIDEKLFDAHLMLPMRFEPGRRCRTKIGFVDPRKYDGELLFPERFDAASQARTEKEMTEYAVAGQMQQRPVPRDGGIYRREWFEIVDTIPAGGVEARAYDFAGTKKSQKNTNPDWTVGLKGKRIGDGTFYVTDMWRDRITAGKVATRVKATATQDGKSCHIRMPQDPGQAGKGQAEMYVSLLAGWPLTVELTSGSGDKEMRARPAATQAEHGKIKLARGDWNKDFLDEVCTFPGGLHDDIVDALSDLIDELSNKSTFNLDNV